MQSRGPLAMLHVSLEELVTLQAAEEEKMLDCFGALTSE